MSEDVNQTQQDEDIDDNNLVQTPQIRPRRHRWRSLCGTCSHR